MGPRGARGSAIYLGFVALTVAILLEGSVRVLGLAPLSTQYGNFVADRLLPWTIVPHSISRGSTPEFTFEYRHNGAGFRDVERSQEKPPATVRIAALGDSFTYGVGAGQQETYPARLEQILSAAPGSTGRVEVLNFGIPRYWPEPERILLQHYALAYRPDVVTVGFLPNDVLDADAGIGSLEVQDGRLVERGRDPLGGVGEWLYPRSALVRVLFRIYRERAAPLPSVPITKAESAAFQTAWERIESEYASILSLSQRANARLAVVVIPQGQPWPPPVDFYPQERLAAWTSAHDVLLIDTTEALQAAAASGVVVYYAQDGHCTPAGYDVVARTIATELTRRGPLAPASAPVDQP